MDLIYILWGSYSYFVVVVASFGTLSRCPTCELEFYCTQAMVLLRLRIAKERPQHSTVYLDFDLHGIEYDHEGFQYLGTLWQ